MVLRRCNGPNGAKKDKAPPKGTGETPATAERHRMKELGGGRLILERKKREKKRGMGVWLWGGGGGITRL